MAQIDSRRWALMSPLLDELLELDDAARAARIAQLRRDDEALASELAALLARQTALDREAFLEGDALHGTAGASLAGQTIGAYTLVEPIGAGGMGSVWLARRSDGRFEGKVAVKLLNLALLARGGAERFAREGNVLARLAHPNIARLLDAGVTTGGQPYLVLEHVEGEPIDRWCEARSLGIEARVRLMQGVFAAVAHAHSKLVLHRDLKPGNILVTHDGQVKLLDFGIAKLLDDEALPAQATELTQLAGRAFTPDYAAPEQVQGGDVTTATDVYTLGVLLYVLLGGAHPTAKPTHTPVERMRAVEETEPPRLSDAALRNDAAATLRGETTLPKLASALRGDLDNIVAKALKKAPAARYPTAAAFADDLRRYLDDEPVAARPDSFGYRSAKFVRRHRVAVGAASATVLMLVAGVIGTTWQAIEARRERDEALFQAERASAKGNLMDIALQATGDPDKPVTRRDILDRSVQLVDKQFARDPRVAVDLLYPLAGQYATLGDSEKDIAVMRRAAEIAAASRDPQLIGHVACNTVYAELSRGQLEAARAQLRAGLLAMKQVARPTLLSVIECMRAEAEVAQAEGDLDRAVERLSSALARVEAANDTQGGAYRTLLGVLAQLHEDRGDLRTSFDVRQRLLRLDEKLGRADSINHLNTQRRQALILMAWGEYLQARAIIDAIVPRLRDATADAAPPAWLDHARGLLLLRFDDLYAAQSVLQSSAQRARASGSVQYALPAEIALAKVLVELRRFDEVGRLLATVEAALPARANNDRRTELATLQATLSLARGSVAEAAQQLDAELARIGYPAARDSPALAAALRAAARVQLAAGDAERAVQMATAAVAVSERVARDPERSADAGEARLLLAQAQRLAGSTRAAVAAAQGAARALASGLGDEHRLTHDARALATAEHASVR